MICGTRITFNKTSRHDITEILLKLALNTNESINKTSTTINHNLLQFSFI